MQTSWGVQHPKMNYESRIMNYFLANIFLYAIIKLGIITSLSAINYLLNDYNLPR